MPRTELAACTLLLCCFWQRETRVILFSSFQLEAIFVRVFITNTPSEKRFTEGLWRKVLGELGRRKSKTVTAQGCDLGGCRVCSGEARLSLPEPGGPRRNLGPLPPQTPQFSFDFEN